MRRGYLYARRSGVGSEEGLAESMGRCPQVPASQPREAKTPWATARRSLPA